ncbi:MAG: excinuclease ABC subunit UvrA [Ignavibacteriae bacterium]|nr:excinuclease ABC subunit UvrA [Ignavibacteriota bacterium]
MKTKVTKKKPTETVSEQSPASPTKSKIISIKNARVHTLKNISVDIPRNAFTVITGVSGSGKSSLAFDTLYAEGQRRFTESLSAYARQFMERMTKPDVDSITGLPPAIAIEQRGFKRNPRSTVGTTTEIYDYLRLLYGRIGKTICKCGREVKKDTPQSAATAIHEHFNNGDRVYILFPLINSDVTLKTQTDELVKQGFSRIMLRNSTTIIDLQDEKLPKGTKEDNILFIADRLIYQKDAESTTRLSDSLELAFSIGKGRITVKNLTSEQDFHFSNVYECPYCQIVYKEPEPRLFSFNSPFGACPRCQGFGRSVGIDEDLVIPDKTKTLRGGAIGIFKTQGFIHVHEEMLAAAERNKIPINKPVAVLTKEQMNIIWKGDSNGFTGINGFFKMLDEQSYKMNYRVLASRYRGYAVCPQCHGSRIRRSAQVVYIDGINIPKIVQMTLDEAQELFKTMKFSEHETAVIGQVLRELRWRLDLLVEIGLGYLTIDRLSHTLSGGESQRINLATSLGSSLVGTLYVLDEPSIGLHPRDTERLVALLKKLRNIGNTVVVVEHDLEIMNNADYIIDMGPFAGERGGEVIYQGDSRDITKAKNSLTADYINGKRSIEFPKERSKGNGHKITINSPVEHNLKGDKIEIPLGCLAIVTGVSGSGKSTLIHDVLYGNLRKLKFGHTTSVGACESIEGSQYIDNLEMIDQSPIGQSSRSTPVTYTKAFDGIREVFASTQAAKQMGWWSGHFSFNVPGGRCEVCEGDGNVTVEMQFLPDITLECESCKGTRYKREARQILYRGKSIIDVLAMTVDEALEFFTGVKKITNKLKVLSDVGLGYIRLGQSSAMLSGGEAQRVKLATYLDADSASRMLFIFDEPTTGLHLHDISKLLKCFRQLIANGHSVVIIEHNLHVIASADYVIDLGPEAGERGGYLVASGTPEAIIKSKQSLTGKALKEFMKG